VSVEFDIKGDVARVTLNRPDRLNAIDSATDAALADIWNRIEGDSRIRCVVLTGTGKAFCAGADMKEDGPDGLTYWASTGDYGFGGNSIGGRISVPIIARVNGLAVGGGFEMVLGCDLIVATETATFGLPEPRVGRLPLDGMITLPRLIPRSLAFGILLTGRTISATEAVDLGLINQAVKAEQLDTAVEALIQDILACGPLSLKAIKRSYYDTAHLPVWQARNSRGRDLIKALQSEDAKEGVIAFREKRPPVWKGC